MLLTEATDRLAGLVHTNLNRAELLAFEVLSENEVELDAVVLWRNEREWGTHRALLSNMSSNGMLVWGHYWGDERGARADYKRRVHPQT